MFVEILPNVMGPIIVEATVRLGYAIFAVAGLTFLGFGVQPPSPDWSLQIADNYTLLNAGTYWWTVLFPALAIATLDRRRQPDRRRAAAGARPVSDALEPLAEPPRPRSSSTTSTSSTACAAATARCCAASR